jgi:hypothetical protein
MLFKLTRVHYKGVWHEVCNHWTQVLNTYRGHSYILHTL